MCVLLPLSTVSKTELQQLYYILRGNKLVKEYSKLTENKGFKTRAALNDSASDQVEIQELPNRVSDASLSQIYSQLNYHSCHMQAFTETYDISKQV